jgi:hypothetical protein
MVPAAMLAKEIRASYRVANDLDQITPGIAAFPGCELFNGHTNLLSTSRI